MPAPSPPSSRVVPRPVPAWQSSDPRAYQMAQLRRRFAAEESTGPDGAASLLFALVPSDPDFPFELSRLDCRLRVPALYPAERPQLLVDNKDLPRGFAINIERGWDRLAEKRRGATLLQLVNALDKELEALLSEQKADTVKLVTFKKGPSKAEPESGDRSAAPASSSSRRPVPDQFYSKEQVAEARARRAQEVRQLEARMSRLPGFARSSDGIIFTLPIEPKRRTELSAGLQSVDSLHLIVPLLYPLQQLRVQLNGPASAEAEPLEDLFSEMAAEQKQMSLMSHVNYLVQNLHLMEKQAREAAAAALEPEADPKTVAAEKAAPTVAAADKSHIHFLARPPEWGGEASERAEDDDEEADEDGDEDESEDDEDESEGQDEVEADAVAEASGVDEEGLQSTERGTMISFPSIELHGIEVVQLSSLGIRVKCERCKSFNEMTDLKPAVEKATHCLKCGSELRATLSRRLVHQHSAGAGFLDLAGCRVVDMLPSRLEPTCGRCSTPCQPLLAAAGERVTNVCRACHARFSLQLPEVKFSLLSAGAGPEPTTRRRRRAERLGLRAGEPLPGRGACQHYRKSYRWFRFSCCETVYRCDKCHDAATDHDMEWATRMICGWCSREQHYAPEACAFCGRSLIGRRGKGFWEGGKGTRDQSLMSRKDRRKYKRRPL